MVCLIEDDKNIQLEYEIIVKSIGMEFASFTSVDEFLSDINPHHKSLIVLDLSLPEMSGCELIQKFYPAFNHIPIIVIAKYYHPQILESCRKYGIKACLRKPVDREALIDLIKYHHPNSSAIASKSDIINSVDCIRNFN